MPTANHPVDLVDESGRPISQKLRRDIDKTTDIYHAVHVLIITPDGRLVLSTIPERPEENHLYAQLLGTPVATIRRSDEPAEAAAYRALQTKVFMHPAELHHLGNSFARLSDGRKTYLSVYFCQAKIPPKFNRRDIAELQSFTAAECQQMLQNDTSRVAPTLRYIWQNHRTQLPLV